MNSKDQELNKPINLAVIALHPVQYHTPLYQEMNKSSVLDTTVLYLRPHGFDVLSNSAGEVKPIIWKQDQLSGYDHKVLRNIDLFVKGGGFLSRINPGLIGEIFSKRYNVILVQGYAQFSMWIALLAAKLSGTKIVWRGEAVGRLNDSRPGWKRWLKKALARIHVSSCDAVMYTCSGNRKFLEGLGIESGSLYPFPCAVDNQQMQESNREFSVLKDETREQLNIPSDHSIIICCGRLAQRKRPLDLLKAVQVLDGKKVTVLFVGDGPQRAELEQFSKVNNISCRFTGFVDQLDLGRYYSVADIFVLISDHDASPKALNEAMNFDLPVIVTKVLGTTDDLVVDGENGFIVDVGDFEEIARKIQTLIEDSNLRKKMSAKSLEIVEMFTFEADVASLENACRDVLAGKLHETHQKI